jgi:molybdate/tungstate transport system substrate-binding protein
MPTTRRALLAPLAAAPFIAAVRPARAAGAITVAYAGSMGVLMDRGLNPDFTAKTGTTVHGIGQAAMGLARLISAQTMRADVFVSVSPAPMKLVEAALLAAHAEPVASTEIVLAYSPKSQFAAPFAATGADWTKILANPALRLGRTDPATDPQGQYVLYTLQLAEIYYRLPGFAEKISGGTLNSAQIFAEPSLLARLADGQIDCTLGYESAVISQKLPYIRLPKELNFSDAGLAKSWYSRASLTLTVKGETKTSHPGALVFYAAALANAADPAAARAYVAYLDSPAGQAIFKQYGYNPGTGAAI